MAARTPRTKPDFPALLDYALKTLSARALSAGEMRTRLRRKGATAELAAQVIAKLAEYQVLDDKRFAETFAAARRDNQGLGQARVLRELRARRVLPAVAEKAVSQAYSSTDEAAMASDFLARKFRKIDLKAYLADPKHLASAYRKLRYSGFSSSASVAALRRFTHRAEEIGEAGEAAAPEE
jgi:regulatory protein